MMRCYAAFVLFLVSFVCRGADAPKPQYKAENVVLLVIDGPRFTETWGDPEHKYIPHIFGDLAKEGAVYPNFSNNGPTLTNPGHAAMTTGYYQMIDNAGKELPHHPTLMQMWLKSSGQPASSAWLICSKDKLEVLANSAEPEWKDKYRCSTDCGVKGLGSGYRDDAITWDAVKTILPRDHPHLVVINLMAPDFYGHAHDWDKYVAGIKNCDAYAWELWQLLQKDPVYANKTDLFITDDHGRHADGHFDGFVSHGDDCPSCKHIICVALGPDFKKNVVIETKRDQIDLAVTMAAILGLEIPGSKGQLMTELFEEKK
jgi:predicted AlkP superfamily pyrophosphatase or phosphodiesterase